jgi:hypothetical protein
MALMNKTDKPVARPLSSVPVSPTRPANISAVAWTPNGKMEYHSWIIEGRRIGAMWKGSPWWVGDWLLYGTVRWGEQYAEAAKITGYDPKSLRNMRYVSSRFELSLRRDNLTWSHHALLAGLDPEEHEFWLDRATADKLSVDDLRIELRSAQRGRYSNSRDVDSPGDRSRDVTVVICPNCGDRVPVPSGVTPKLKTSSATV